MSLIEQAMRANDGATEHRQHPPVPTPTWSGKGAVVKTTRIGSRRVFQS